MQVYVYNTTTNSLKLFNRNLTDAMPYIQNRYLTVQEFRGSSNSNVLWTSEQAMDSFNKLRGQWKKPIKVGYAFQRISRGGHGSQSQHYAGLAFDIGQNLNNSERNKLRTLASKMRIWSYVEPASLTPTWVHVDKRYGTPACGAGYPVLRNGSKGNYVFVLQDALGKLNYFNQAYTGNFGNVTENSVKSFQQSEGLAQSGEVHCATWQAITKRM